MENLKEQILRLKKEKNAVILAHYYQQPDIQEIADYVGDSLGLSQEAEKVNADIIVFAGVHFMAETAKLLNPKKKVLLDDLTVGDYEKEIGAVGSQLFCKEVGRGFFWRVNGKGELQIKSFLFDGRGLKAQGAALGTIWSCDDGDKRRFLLD